MTIWGRKTTTEPTPLMTPSTSRLRRKPSGRVEHDEQQREQEKGSGDRVQRDAVQRGGDLARARCRDRGGARDAARLALEMADVGIDTVGVDAGNGTGAQRLGQHGAQRVQATAAHRDGCDHGQAEFAGQRGDVDLQPVAFRHVDHVERQHHRQAEATQLEGESQVVVEIGGVGDDDDRVRPTLARLPPHHDLAGDFLVGAGRIEAVGAGQVDQFDRAAVVECQAARMPLDCDAGIIADLLPRAGQRVEQRGFAGIGIADQRDQRKRGHGPLRQAGRGSRGRYARGT